MKKPNCILFLGRVGIQGSNFYRLSTMSQVPSEVYYLSSSI